MMNAIRSIRLTSCHIYPPLVKFNISYSSFTTFSKLTRASPMVNVSTTHCRYFSTDDTLRNKQIRFEEMRVIYNDPITNAKEWKILSRIDALELAKSMNLDLILGKCVCYDEQDDVFVLLLILLNVICTNQYNYCILPYHCCHGVITCSGIE